MHEFSGTFRGGPATFRVTSVKGHVYNLVFTPEWWALPWPSLAPRRSRTHMRARLTTCCPFGVRREAWDVDPQLLFGAETTKVPTSGAVCAHLEHEAKGADHLVLWLDCDREGENICFEVAPHRSPRPPPHRALHSPSARSSHDARAAAANPAQVMHKCCPAMAGGPGQRVWRARFSAVSEEAVLTPLPSPRNP